MSLFAVDKNSARILPDLYNFSTVLNRRKCSHSEKF